MEKSDYPIPPWLLLGAAALLATALLYLSGLSGTFVLDDIPNLTILNQIPPDPQWRDFLYLANSGSAGPLGRPLSLLTFLAQYQSWPDPFGFKLVNLLLHLVNGLLVAVCCILISRQRARVSLYPLSVVCITFIWLLHPLQVSTVLYVVQRMTELATLFTLLGIALYLQGRLTLCKGRLRSGLALMLAGVGLCGLLALLSKESGVLILVYLAVLEWTLLESESDSDALRYARRLLVMIPLIVLLVAFAAYLPSALDGYALKPFSLAERILSQPAVLLTYLGSAALLLPGYFGLFHDDFPLATGLLQPLWTLPALLLVLALLALAVMNRRRWPLFSFAVLWFFAGHGLESTALPLELYFEHRNYLPLLGPVFALVVAVQQALQGASAGLRRAGAGLLGLVLAWMCLLTFEQTRLWGEPLAMAYAQVDAHPDSSRARSNLVQVLSASGQVEEAYTFHLRTIDENPASITPYIRWLEFRCLMPDSDLPAAAVLSDKAASSPHDYSAIALLNNLTFGIIQNRCPGAPREQLLLVIRTLETNPAYAINEPDLLQLRGFLAAGAGDFAEAAQLAARSYSLRPDVRVSLYRATWLLRAGQIDGAQAELRHLQETHRDVISASSELTLRYETLRSELPP